MVLHQLYDHTDIIAIILDRNHAHDVGCILGIRIWTVLVCKHKTGVSFMNLDGDMIQGFSCTGYFYLTESNIGQTEDNPAITMMDKCINISTFRTFTTWI